jgi:hypothetical protein
MAGCPLASVQPCMISLRFLFISSVDVAPERRPTSLAEKCFLLGFMSISSLLVIDWIRNMPS